MNTIGRSINATFIQSPPQQRAARYITTTEQANEKHKLQQPPNTITHTLTGKETLPGLALRYGVTVGELKSLNNIWKESDLISRKTVLVPNQHATEDQQQQLAPPIQLTQQQLQRKQMQEMLRTQMYYLPQDKSSTLLSTKTNPLPPDSNGITISNNDNSNNNNNNSKHATSNGNNSFHTSNISPNSGGTNGDEVIHGAKYGVIKQKNTSPLVKRKKKQCKELEDYIETL